MAKRTKLIPVHSLPDGQELGIVVGRMSSEAIPLEEASHAHRHDFHFFAIQEKGMSRFEIDFKQYSLGPSTVLYLHPDQVHRFIETNDTTICGLLITSENLRAEYVSMLEEIVPAQPLLLHATALSLISDTATLCIQSYERQHDEVYRTLLKDTSNALVALILSAYREQSKPSEKPARFEAISKAFRTMLNRNFTLLKRPGDYAKILNISTAYMNECVKNTTGQPVSYHIQQRIVLEAKRLLHHSDKSVKEIAGELGYDDYPYFSRLFTKVAGMTAMSFRNKNHD